MNNIKKTRDSNIELLRIISMIMIVVHHYEMYAGFTNSGNLSLNSYIEIVLYSFGKLGVNIFVIISGYFLINSRFNTKKLIKLWMQIFFYSVSIMIILKMLNIVNVTTKENFKYFFPISYKKYWFASTYMYLYLIFPFLNKFAHGIDKKTYKVVLILLSMMFSITYSIIYKSNSFQTDTGTFESLVWFVFLYLLAGYIKIYGIKFLENKRKNIIFTIILLIVFLGILFISHFIYIKFHKLKNIINYYTRMNSIFLLLLAVTIFYVFKNIKIKNNKVINLIARNSFAVYLIHEHELIRATMWKFIKSIVMQYGNEYIIILCCIVIFFTIAGIIEKIRMFLEKHVLKIKIFEKIFIKYDDLMNVDERK